MVSRCVQQESTQQHVPTQYSALFLLYQCLNFPALATLRNECVVGVCERGRQADYRDPLTIQVSWTVVVASKNLSSNHTVPLEGQLGPTWGRHVGEFDTRYAPFRDLDSTEGGRTGCGRLIRLVLRCKVW